MRVARLAAALLFALSPAVAPAQSAADKVTRADDPDAKESVTSRVPLDEIRRFVGVYNAVRAAYVDPVDDKKLMQSAVRGLLLEAFRSEMTIDYKVDLHDVVTVHDKRAEATIRAFILEREPNSAIMGEEGGQVGDGDIQWYVDPIDGTANFARGLAFWCVSLAAVEGRTVLAGAVYDPVADQMFSADLEGAYLNGRPLVSRSVLEETRATLDFDPEVWDAEPREDARIFLEDAEGERAVSLVVQGAR